MKVVIELDRADYMYIKNGCVVPIKIDNHIYDAIRGGTVLPKGHGDLIDRNVTYAEFDKAHLSKKEMIGKLIVFGVPAVIPADNEVD